MPGSRVYLFLPDKSRFLRKVRKILTVALLSLLGLLLLISILINIPAFQNLLVHQVTQRLSRELGARVEIRQVNFRLFNSMRLEGTYIEDLHKDTLLYAGALQLRITDWFFIQDKPVLKFLGLEDAQVNLIRPKRDSVWNYQFIADALGGPSKAPSTSSEKEGLSLDLKQIDLRRVRFNFIDGWIGQDMRVSANRIFLNAEKLDLRARNVLVNELLLDKPVFIVADYDATRPKRPPAVFPLAPPPPVDSLKPAELRWNADNWKLLVKSIRITDGLLGVDNLRDTVPSTEGYFDPSRIRFGNINLTLSNSQLVKDSIFADLRLTTKERSGFEVKQLTCRFKMSPVDMEFTNLDLFTNNSHIQDYFTMEYEDLSDMNDFVDAVNMRAKFRDTRLSSDDIAFFAPLLATWKTDIRVSGEAEGPVSNLSADNLRISAGTMSSFEGNGKMRGLPDINQTFMEFTAKELITNGKDVRQFIPMLETVKNVRTDLITRLSFQGSFVGFVNDFVAYGKFQTNLGNLESDLNFKTSGDVPVYSGSLTTERFEIGTLLDNTIVGMLTMKAEVKGAGFNIKTLKSSLDADIQQIDLYGYQYRNLKTTGELNRKFFSGSLTVNDPNLDMDFAGTVDFNSELPLFQLHSDIRYSDLKALHLTKDSITLQAKTDLNFMGSNIDNFVGTARLYDVSLFKNKSRVEFDSLAITTENEGQEKMLRVKGNEINGYVQGQYSFLELPHSFALFLHKYYPGFFKSPPAMNTGQNFRFSFEFGNVDKLIRAFTNDVRGFNGTQVAGALNTQTGKVSLSAAVPYGVYQSYGVRDLLLKGNGDFNRINVSTSIGQALYNDSVIFHNPAIIASSSRDTSFIKIDLKAEDTTDLDGFYARVITVGDGVKVNFLNSTFTVNGRQWSMMPGNEVYWSKDFLTVHNLRISRNLQSINISTNEFNPDDSRFLIALKDLNLADIVPPGVTTTRVEGLLNGNIDIIHPFDKLSIAADLTSTQLRIDNDSIGLVKLKGGYSMQQGSVTFDVAADNPMGNFTVKGTVGVSDSNRVLNASADMDHASIALLEKYLSEYVSELSGFATGKLTVSGTRDKPSFRGSVKVQDIGLKVNYLGTYYKIPLLHVHNMDDNLIEMKRFTIIDKFNNEATVNGFISHENFYNMNFEFDLNTRKFLFLHTNSQDNSLYYGDAIAQGRVYFNGPLNDLQLRVLARPLAGTHFYLPISDSKNIGKYDFIKFRQYGTMREEQRRKSNIKLNVKLDIAANPDAQIDVILNATTNDVISANGTGNLQMNVNLDGDFTMYGNYVINQGSYNFSLQRFANWKFDIDKNSTITWNGDPSEAKLNITAKYTLPKVSLYNLSAGAYATDAGTTNANQGQANRQERVDILIFLRGALLQPTIAYEISLPDLGSLSFENTAAARLKEINQDQNQALYQMYGLLVSGQFLPPDGGGAANVAVTGRNSVGQALSAQASAILNNLSSTFLKNTGIGFNVNYYAYNFNQSQSSSFDRNLVSAGVTKNFLNNRIRLYVGGDYDWGRVSATASTQNFAGDFRVEYLLTQDGRVRINAFSKTDYDAYYLTNRMRSGLGLSYVRDYDRLIELFQDRRQRFLADSFRRAARLRQQQDDSLERATQPADTGNIKKD